jgi:hypothetical protein
MWQDSPHPAIPCQIVLPVKITIQAFLPAVFNQPPALVGNPLSGLVNV